jgi:hypothetical protein
VKTNAASNNGMHPTAHSVDVIVNLPLLTLNARRVMTGVMLLSQALLNRIERRGGA